MGPDAPDMGLVGVGEFWSKMIRVPHEVDIENSKEYLLFPAI